MKWLVLAGFIVYLATYSEGSALRCKPGTKNACQTNGTIKDVTETLYSKVRRHNDTREAVCLAGSEWTSKCQRCRCTDKGQPECTKLDDCQNDEHGGPMICKPLTEFYRDCNVCICLNNGLDISCTQQECSTKKVLPDGKDCQVGSRWRSKCNECSCEDGLPACTEMACPGGEDEPELMCKPGTEWKIDCNTCTCLPNGRALCSRLGCGLHDASDFKPDDGVDDKLEMENVFWNDHNRVKRSRVCKPNNVYKVDCNSCKCAPDAQSYTCTLNECLEEEDKNANAGRNINKDVEVFMESKAPDHIERNSEQVCKPRGTFRIRCNICLCTVDGTDFSCTNKPCPLPADVEIFRELKVLRTSPIKKTVVCTANRMFIKDCNTCWCNEDGTSYFCTRRVCSADVIEDIEDKPENLQEIKRKCRPDEVFELECNMCRCATDGMSFSCTRRACIPEDDGKNVSLTRKIRATSQETLKACTPGQEFRMDCNMCLCNNEGQDFSCTRNDCSAQNNNRNSGTRAKREVATQVKTDCEPGSVFSQGCNTCQCTADGNHATCTIKRCKVDNPNENDIDLSESDPSFRCNPGEQFKKGCNDCTCSADGKSVFCTLRLCDQDITPTI
ncbi:unnamed protein product, partial [Brenthis ino]